jgi:hypothetical protein
MRTGLLSITLTLIASVAMSLNRSDQGVGDFFPLQNGRVWEYTYKATEKIYLDISFVEQMKVDSGIVRFSVVSHVSTDTALVWTIHEKDSMLVHIQDFWRGRDTVYTAVEEGDFELVERLDSVHTILCKSETPPFCSPIECRGSSGVPFTRYGPDRSTVLRSELFYAGSVFSVRDTFLLQQGVGIVRATSQITKGPNIPYSLVWNADLVTTQSSGADSPYFPLQVGSKWTFAAPLFPHSEQITDTATIAGRVYYGMTIWGNSPAFWLRTSHDSVFIMSSMQDTSERLLYNFSARVGDTLSLPVTYACSYGLKIVLKSKEDTVTTPAGTFAQCYHFVHLAACMDGGIVESWFAKGVGRIKYSEESIMGLRTYELSSYSIVTAAGEDLPKPGIGAFVLLDAYPNPFNPKTVVSCQLPVVSDVKLIVYDMLGREVAVLLNGRKEAGRHVVTFDGSGLASGVYLYRMHAGSYVETKKLLLLR